MKRLYFPLELYDASNRWHIFPLLKSLQKEPNTSFQDFELIDDELKADLIILPMSWNYYHITNQIEAVLIYLNQKLGNNKPTISFVFGDIGYFVPKSFNGFVFRSSGRKSKLPKIHLGMPIFLDDPINKYYSKDYKINKSVSTIPIIGFCGQANRFGFRSLKEYFKTVLKNLLSAFRLIKQESDQLISTTYFRWKILNTIEKSNRITSNFIIRNNYRAGVKTNKETHPSTLQFYDNIKESDYVVCMRGAGNFSTRFYETLAMGRIPIFVDTDCLLPLETIINWKEHVVWVAYHERHLIVEKVIEFHKKHNNDSLNALFLKNRTIWEDYLQLYPFFNISINEIRKIVS